MSISIDVDVMGRHAATLAALASDLEIAPANSEAIAEAAGHSDLAVGIAEFSQCVVLEHRALVGLIAALARDLGDGAEGFTQVDRQIAGDVRRSHSQSDAPVLEV